METPAELHYRLNKKKIDHAKLKEITNKFEEKSVKSSVIVEHLDPHTIEYLFILGYTVTITKSWPNMYQITRPTISTMSNETFHLIKEHSGRIEYAKSQEKISKMCEKYVVLCHNLDFDLSEEEIIAIFERHFNCSVKDVALEFHENGKPKGSCQIEMLDSRSVKVALSYSGFKIQGREITIKEKQTTK
jgi:RNA recognition motif-containing protein